MPEASIDEFIWEGHRLVYETHGEGPRTFVFLHGLLLDATLNRGIGRALAERGHRVVLLDLLGHGRSDHPTHAYDHRMELWAEQTVALLDHLELDQAVIGGVSLGANVALQVAHGAPDRVRGMVLEMPVLERGTMVGAAVFLPIMVSLRYLPWAWAPLRRLARAFPATGHPLDPFVTLMGVHPRELGAVLHGLFVGAVTPPEKSRRNMHIPSLVLGHRRDPLHAVDDATALVRELPDSRFVEANSIIEARTRPARVLDEMDAFLHGVWEPSSVDRSTGS
ncbi:MAG: alpha/beta hydrolase [Nitriliruptor sp.]|uniref:alpha/beta fold hydrolase n=1 Tax=Nitriliruptor sp. TaxID=2448056 RepID=UPI00349FE38C